jgi:sugar phosphate isomerase/epimerase
MDLIDRRNFLGAVAAGTIACATGSAFAQTPTKSRYKIIGFSKPFQNLSHEETADTVAQIGWDGIECPVRAKGQIEPDKAEEELPKLIAALKKRGKEVTILTTDIKSADRDAEKLLRLGKKLGIERYRVGFFMYTDKKSIPDQFKEVAAALKDVAAMNKEIGITGGIQNHSGADHFGAPVWDIWTAIKDLDPRHLGNFFDIAHATIEGGSSWPIESRLMEKYFMTVSVKDFIWEKTPKGGKSKWVPLGDGLVSRTFFDWLKTTSFHGPISHHAEYEHGKGAEMIARLQKDVKILREWVA